MIAWLQLKMLQARSIFSTSAGTSNGGNETDALKVTPREKTQQLKFFVCLCFSSQVRFPSSCYVMPHGSHDEAGGRCPGNTSECSDIHCLICWWADHDR
jgi:hypothetical protein